MSSKPSSLQDLSKSEFQNRWRIVEQLGTGGYAGIYRLMEKRTGYVYAMKLALDDDDVSIKREAAVYEVMKEKGHRTGNAIMHSYGILDGNNYLIMNLLGENMFNYARSVNDGNGLTLGFVIPFGISALRTINYLHCIGFLHRDVKPDNFVCGARGTKDEDICHLIDFGAATKYQIGEGKEKRHIDFKVEDRYYPGTMRYGTANQNEGYTATRRDDLESLMYTMIVLFKNKLPWDILVEKNSRGENNRNEVIHMKRAVEPAVLCEGMPHHMQVFFEHVRSLDAKENPNYKYLEKCLREAYVEACWVGPSE